MAPLPGRRVFSEESGKESVTERDHTPAGSLTRVRSDRVACVQSALVSSEAGGDTVTFLEQNIYDRGAANLAEPSLWQIAHR